MIVHNGINFDALIMQNGQPTLLFTVLWLQLSAFAPAYLSFWEFGYRSSDPLSPLLHVAD